MSEEHPAMDGTLAAWMIDACPPDEASRVADHVASCPGCSAEADRLRGGAALLAATLEPPPPPLRAAVLSAAFRRRPPGTPAHQDGDLTAAYAGQVARMNGLLATLGAATWRAPLPGYDSVEALIVHLTRNDSMFATDLGLAPVAAGARPRDSWHEQARAVLRDVSTGTRSLDAQVRLAGTSPAYGPARAALVQRTFETWIHADDIRMVVGRPAEPPPAAHQRLIAELGIGLLPKALRAAGRHHPRRTARLVLTGPAGGEWTVPLAPGDEPGRPDVTITAAMEEFCRLLANRRVPAAFPHRAVGDRALAADLLAVAATLGCD
ncbi:hypothetical protein DPM19_02945 [Actinomadura craniellae]|uniref:Mycothiol-dependent maleylpyruvate isomerase metal-binding domain-containing protein n=1 Tax=Actinomadura craniellae TaxID=2231787 RepID=A0A365HDF0_9ACTN|nr:maleylpyruvate isomerase family mycothiol-dependent enzyme [Actinomadura craniellae]RAY17131.1 hypothetical protein DPM19_02945 [Actinomadura craniellae]